jgi:hypothetical protein
MTSYQLRPMSVGEILDTAFAVYRREFITFVGIAVVGYGAGTVVTTYVTIAGGIFEHLWLGLVGQLLKGIGGLLASAATVFVISGTYLGEQPMLRDALDYGRRRMWPLFVAYVAVYLVLFAAALALLFPAIIVACGYAVVAQVVVLEQPAASTDALARSWALTKGDRLRAFALGIVIFFLIALPFFGAAVLATLFKPMDIPLRVAGDIVSVIVVPLVSCVYTIFYYDLRVRKEAFDLQVLSNQLGTAAPA